MPFLILALFILWIACSANPGLFTLLLIIAVVAFVVAAIVSMIKARRDVKWFDEQVKKYNIHDDPNDEIN